MRDASVVTAGEDARFMAAAVRLSRRNIGLTADNPSVGALIVQGVGSEARIVGRGVTAPGGRPHAERVALAEAGEAARGATAYVTLEPCAHHGRTSPCAKALVQAGVARVVVGAHDPDPRVDGRGFSILEQGGVCVADRPMREAERSVEGFLWRLQRARPFVTLKMAVSADGFVGRLGSGNTTITGPVANRQTHVLRAVNDAIMIGIGTAIADNPALTCRLSGLEDRSPVRVVVDPRLRLPLSSRLVRSARDTPTLIATTAPADDPRTFAHRDAGCRFVPLDGNGIQALDRLLSALAKAGVSSLMVEGGPVLASALLRADLVDRLIAIRSAVVIGDGGVAAPSEIAHPTRFRAVGRERFGADLWAEYERVED